MHINSLIGRIQPAAAVVAKHSKTAKSYLAAFVLVAESVHLAADKIAQASKLIQP